jgi:hypothetical protein
MESIMFLLNPLPRGATNESTSQGWIVHVAWKRPLKIEDPR